MVKLTSSLTNLCLNETSDEACKRQVAECMNDMLGQLELNVQQQDSLETTNELETSDDYKNLDGSSFKEDDNEADTEGTVNATAEVELNTEPMNEAEESGSLSLDTKPTKAANEDADNELIFDTCVQQLKQLFYTFVVNHLFQPVSEASAGDANSVNRAFENLFNHED